MSSRNPKRTNESAFPIESLMSASGSSKRARFDARNPSTLVADAPEDDAILELDEIGKGMQTKRNAVKLDGYESDSSTENFDARADQKILKARAQKKSKDEDETDMFADLEEAQFADGDEDEELAQEGKRKKKDVKFLDESEIEGQVASSKSGGHVSADFSLGDGKGKEAVGTEVESSSESGDDEERDRLDSDLDEEIGAGGKKKHAPKLDAFNMRSENEEGRFDTSGNYVRKALDPDAVHDTWLEGLSKKDMKKAREAQEKRDEDRRKKDAADDSLLTSDLLDSLISRLEKGETTLEALQRLGKGRTKKKPKWQKSKRRGSHQGGDDMEVDAEQAEDPTETKRRETVEIITEAANQLLTRGETDIYDTERELLLRQYKRETGEEWKEPKPTEYVPSQGKVQQWEYRWSDARDGGETHGPYDGNAMVAWNDAGYFGEGVEFRSVGETEWSRSVDFV